MPNLLLATAAPRAYATRFRQPFNLFQINLKIGLMRRRYLTMKHLERCEQTIISLQGRVLQLETELERKDEMHVFEIRLLRDHLTNLIKTYKLD